MQYFTPFPCLTLTLNQNTQMPPKKKPLPLHVSRALIEAEQRNVLRRTQSCIAQLHATENMRDHENVEARVVAVHSHCYLNIFCFCALLVTMNLLYLQWLYYEVRNYKQL